MHCVDKFGRSKLDITTRWFLPCSNILMSIKIPSQITFCRWCNDRSPRCLNRYAKSTPRGGAMCAGHKELHRDDVLVITEIICYRFAVFFGKINICIFTRFGLRGCLVSKLPKLNNYGLLARLAPPSLPHKKIVAANMRVIMRHRSGFRRLLLI